MYIEYVPTEVLQRIRELLFSFTASLFQDQISILGGTNRHKNYENEEEKKMHSHCATKSPRY